MMILPISCSAFPRIALLVALMAGSMPAVAQESTGQSATQISTNQAAGEVVLIPNRVIYPGELIELAALKPVTLIPGKHKPDAVATRAEELNGKVAKRTLLPGRYIPTSAIRDAWLVEQGAAVQVFFTAGTLTISATAAVSYTHLYMANITNVKSVDDLMSDKRLYTYALASVGLDAATENGDTIKQVLLGGIRDPNSVANKMTDKTYAALASTFNFEQYGENTTTYNAAQQPTVDKYLRQTLEENAGESNQGVRLALYFQRKAPTITNWYDVLADTALASVVRTALGLPDSFATADIDKQAQLFEQKLNISDFTDPTKLGKFLTRFTSMWEINNPTSPAVTSVSVLFAQPTSVGISTDLMMAMLKLRS